MQILALLDDIAVKRLRLAVDRKIKVHHIDGAALATRLADQARTLVVVDPSRVRPDAFVSLVETARSRGNVAVLVYAALTADTARAAVTASQILPIETVFFDAYNEHDALAHACGLLLVPSVPALVLRGLAPMVGMMPRRLATRVVGLFGRQPIPSSTSAMLDGLGVPVDTAHDWFVAAGIAKPHHLRACAVLARAYPDLGRKQSRLDLIADAFGAGSVRSLGRACLTLTQLSARRAGRLGEVDFAGRMLSTLLNVHTRSVAAV